MTIRIPSATLRHAPAVLLALAAFTACGAESPAADPHAAHRAAAAAAAAAADPHAQHAQGAPMTVKRSAVTYLLPDVQLVRHDGKRLALKEALGDDLPVFVNFIYTSCTTICPLSSQVFALLQAKLAAEHGRAHLVSVSIDAEQDTPAKLVEYARRFHAGADWDHFTGTAAASVATQRAFGVYRGDKMNHQPVTLARAAHGTQWIRLDGFATADDLLSEYKALVAMH